MPVKRGAVLPGPERPGHGPEPEAEPGSGAAPSRTRVRKGRRLLLLAVDAALPVGLYYLLRAAGCDVHLSLIVSTIPPLVSAGVQFARERRLDGLAAFFAAVMLLSLGMSLINGSTRFLLAKDGYTTFIGGLWYLASLRARRPLLFHGARPLLEGHFRSDGTSWDVLWEREPRFRRIWRVATVIWAVALLLDGVARVAMAYLLPVDQVPALGALLWPVTLGLLQVVNNVYFQLAGLWRITSGEGARR
ncbi:VC0807 family protein [Streptacidiphilus sp. P02-A3a]|uniref:VC0807 family protein n=1 Tax=Streptacidiphilus sp. P02-A3a TaxID=2704468 RepID=UPI0015FD76F1|nr:VC0807 family protein [Streptacidiphilus sp. P02-A3a]QMU73087.1 hypothetical protein GXP74_37450 [Streptacidiphilus sp. P02-A3a]